MVKSMVVNGEVHLLRGGAYLKRVSYFLLTSALTISGSIYALGYLMASPLDALYVLPVAFLATALGANTACHMYFTHKSFEPTPIFRVVLAVLGTILCQDSIVQWAASHKRHHRYVDTVDKDPHTPRQFGDTVARKFSLGLFWASAGWKFSRVLTSKKFYARELLEDPFTAWFDRYFFIISMAGFAAPFALGWLIGGPPLAFKWFCYFGALRVFIGYFFTEFVVNGLCHTLGSKKFDIRGNSFNLVFLAPFTFGATLHHNHHAFPRALSAAVDHEIDTMQGLYWCLQKLRIIKIVERPSANEIEAKKIRSASSILVRSDKNGSV